MGPLLRLLRHDVKDPPDYPHVITGVRIIRKPRLEILQHRPQHALHDGDDAR